jgi:F0F1-type ATP synthase assembly protein I
MRMLADFLFLILFFVLLAAWVLVWAVFHLAGGLIHLLLVIAVIALLLHLFRGHRTVA